MSPHQRFKKFYISLWHFLFIWLPSNCQYIFIYDFCSLGNHIFSASTNKTNLLIGCFKIHEVKLAFFSPINNSILQTILFLSFLISKICPIGQMFCAASVWINSISFFSFEISLFCSLFWSCLKSGQEFFPPSGPICIS